MTDRCPPAMHTLLFLEPGHFHAALTLRVANARIDPAIQLYARPGPERDAFVALVRSFNARLNGRPTGTSGFTNQSTRSGRWSRSGAATSSSSPGAHGPS